MRRALLIGVTVSTIALGTAAVNAGALTAMASAGHPWNGTGLDGMTASDGTITTPPDGSVHIWVVPFQLATTNATYSGIQYTNVVDNGTGKAQVASRLVSFNTNGTVFNL